MQLRTCFQRCPTFCPTRRPNTCNFLQQIQLDLSSNKRKKRFKPTDHLSPFLALWSWIETPCHGLHVVGKEQYLISYRKGKPWCLTSMGIEHSSRQSLLRLKGEICSPVLASITVNHLYAFSPASFDQQHCRRFIADGCSCWWSSTLCTAVLRGKPGIARGAWMRGAPARVLGWMTF